MIRHLLIIFSLFICCGTISAQQPAKSKEQAELEKERQQLKKELEEAEKLYEKNKKLTKDNLGTLSIYNNKLKIQEKVVNNLSREINLMDNNIVKSQRDVRKLSQLLDTLKQEYAKSMVYAYKNRSNADFLNFIFSSSGFNDAIKRVAYLKSYRNYREMQGENILRTQALLKTRVTELNQSKQQKSVALETQDKEKASLAQQQVVQKKIVEELKAQGKELNKQIASKKKQMQKVKNAIDAAIKRAQKEAIAAAKAAAERDRIAAAGSKPATGGGSKPTVKPSTKPKDEPKASVLLPTEADVKLNASFERNRGSLPWPVDKGYILMHQGSNKLPNGVDMNHAGIAIGSDIGNAVKAVFDGEVSSITNIDDMQVVIIKHGKYFTSYSNLTGVTVSRGQTIHTGQTIGRVAPNFDGIGAIDMYISNEQGSNLNPESWLKRR